MTATALTAIALLTAGPATVSAATAAERTAAMACGLHRAGTQALYTSCDDRNEWIFVTRIFGSNQYHCAGARRTIDVGPWNDVFRVYHQHWGC